ncbi:phosphomannomutase/phosphoglucomutase-like [Pyrus ussuriensis x Pyrus communis]|uniref:Phosphomannomutase/phosphoglucomutase-like n=1 Tax=Pyrus ussuriensis x Pyrus communis TaxID=2448454 RepID=A0A5N5GZR6_9ROSA|nr:phosphomannomutase/phosphoglucomutase-like [Pyrus ussuriensis x Pyrus communis]
MVVKINFEMVRIKLTGSDKGVGSIIKDLEEPSESIKLRMDGLSEPRYEKEKAEGRLEGWELDLSGDCWVSKECMVDSNVAAAAVDAHMYRCCTV